MVHAAVSRLGGLYVAPLLLWGAVSSITNTHAAAALEEQEVLWEAELTKEAQRILDKLERIDGQLPAGRVHAFIDLTARSIRLEFGRDFLPRYAGASFEDQLDQFRHGVTQAAAPFFSSGSMEYRIQGRAIIEYFPEQQREDAEASKGRQGG